MAVPGGIMFTVAGIGGQLVMNGLNRWRVRYIYEHEDEWNENSRLSELNKTRGSVDAVGGIEGMEKHRELDQKFGFLDGLADIKTKGTSKRMKLLMDEVEKLDRKIRQVDEDIEALERTRDEVHENGK